DHAPLRDVPADASSGSREARRSSKPGGMKGRAGEWRARLLLAAVSCFLSLVFAEIAARVLLRPTPSGPIEGTPISELSPTLGWITRPNGSQRIRREDFEVSVSINSRGLRGPELPYEPLAGRRRLAIMGDSFAHGYYADDPQTVRGRLATALDKCGVDALNAGQPGYSTDQEWLYFNEEIHKYHPSEVVLFFYYNDLQFNIDGMGTANRAKPYFIENEGTLQLVPPEPITPAPAKGLDPDKLEARREAALARAATRRQAPRFHKSALWAFAANRLQRGRPDWARSLSEYGLTPATSSHPPTEFIPFGPQGSREQASVDQMWKRTEAIFARFRDDVRKTGAGFTVFYVPARFEANDEAWSFIQRRYEPDRNWTREAVVPRLASLLAKLDIPLVDASGGFQAAEKSKNPAYLAIDGHWNARGNEIAFESLLPLMRRAFACGV
ncbi:MAG: SGNH/GDSL hydrolase family protein, partial [Vicinamibacteria bacterium]